MAIDDIHFLYKNSSKENIVLLIDSGKRDKKKYKTPSEFVIEFPEPFKHVIGVEVLNASIPRTTFTVDKHNNSIRLWSYEYGIDVNNEHTITNDFRVEVITANDFPSAEKLLSAMTSKFRERDETFNVEADSLALESDADISTKGYLKLESTWSPFIVDGRTLNSPLCPLLGFSLLANDKDDTYDTLDHIKNSRQLVFPLNIGEQKIDRANLISHTYKVHTKVNTAEDSFDITLPFEYFNCTLLIESIEIDQVEYDIRQLASIFSVDGTLGIPFTSEMEIKNKDDVVIEVRYTFLMPNGKRFQELDPYHTYVSRLSSHNLSEDDPVTVREDESSNGVGKTVLSFFNDSTRLSVFLHQFKLQVEEIPNVAPGGKILAFFSSTNQSKRHDFLLEVEYYKEEDKFTLNFDVSKYFIGNLNPINFMRIFNVEYEMYHMVDDDVNDAHRLNILQVFENDPESNVTVNSVLYDVQFKVVPPGIINMVTENYVILRCPEIENHSRGSYDANDASPGLALFTIDVASGYAANKSEFFSVKYKEFHPIGKLARLHFRFERKSDKQLYDFKGVDLHFILSLKMLAAQKLNDRELEYTLNPNYDPDYQGFVKSSFDNVESDEEMDERLVTQRDFDEEVQLQNLSHQRRLNLQESSSSESEEYSTDDED